MPSTLRFIKRLRIAEVRAKGASNWPVVVIAEHNMGQGQRYQSTIEISRAMCERYHLHPSLAWVNHDLVCTLTSRLLPLRMVSVPNPDGGQDRYRIIATRAVGVDTLLIKTVQETTVSEFHAREREVPVKETIKQHILRLTSGNRLPAGAYRLGSPGSVIEIGLTEDEYRACRTLPAHAVFRLDLRVKKPFNTPKLRMLTPRPTGRIHVVAKMNRRV